MTPAEKEKLEVLAGDRPRAIDDSALRLRQAKAMLDNLPAEPTGDAAADMRALYAAFNRLRIALR